MHNVVIKTYVREFASGRTVKFIRNKVPAGFGSILEEFEAEAVEVDYEEKFKKMLDSTDVSDSKWSQKVTRKQIKASLKDCLHEILQEWYNKFLDALDELIEAKISEAVIESSKRRCVIKNIVYNFSTKDVSKDIIEALNNILIYL